MKNTFSIDLEADSSQYGETANTALCDGLQTLTVESWIRPESITASHAILSKWKTGNGFVFIFYFTLTDLNFFIATDTVGNGKIASFTHSFVPGTDVHVGAVFDGTQGVNADKAKLYVNGLPVATTVDASFPTTTLSGESDVPIQVGRYNTSNYFDGLIDESRIWNTARTPQQMLSNYRKQVPNNSTGLILNYRYNEGTGTTVNDESASGLDLTLQNSPAWSTDVPFVGTKHQGNVLVF